MDISNGYLGYFNGYFILIPRIFHCAISYGCLGDFNGYFIWIPRIFHCTFHMDT
jgi:hypothetical protein